MDHKERMEAALERQGLTPLKLRYEDDHIATCASRVTTDSGLWELGDWKFHANDSSWHRMANRGQWLGVSELARIPPVAALLEACKTIATCGICLQCFYESCTVECSCSCHRHEKEALEMVHTAIAAFEDHDAR